MWVDFSKDACSTILAVEPYWQTICVPILRFPFWRTEIQTFFHGHTKQLWMPILGGSIWLQNYSSGSSPGYICKWLTYNTKNGGKCITGYCCMSPIMHPLLVRTYNPGKDCRLLISFLIRDVWDMTSWDQ